MKFEELLFKHMCESTTLNKLQRDAFECMKNRQNLFLTGKSGSGKSYVVSLFKSIYECDRKIAITSTTGTSALLINGTTLHSYLGIGLGTDSIENLVKKVTKTSFLRRRYIDLEVLIIDEVSMLSPDLFDKIEEIIRVVRNIDKPFGGVQVILTGDFLQLPTIDSNEFCFKAKSWDSCIKKVIYLTEIVRQKDVKFQKCLNEVRLANLSDETKNLLIERQDVVLHNEFNVKPTKICSLNSKVDEINNHELDILAKNESIEFLEYNMEITLHEKNQAYIIDKFKKNCIASETLQLCVGAQVMLLKNLDLEAGLANGSRGVVIDFVEDIPKVKFLSGLETFIDYNVWQVMENNKVVLSARQIPLKIAFGISVHKAQGLTLDYAEIDLSNVFEYGQAYVALSRVKNLEGLCIRGLDFMRIKAHPEALKYYANLEKSYLKDGLII